MKRFRKKDGVTTIEILIGMMIFLMLLCFMMDILTLSWRFISLSSVNNNITRAVSVQGGVRTSAPSGYPGGNSDYLSSSELYSIVKDNLNKSGVETSDFNVYINGSRLRSSSNIQIDYLKPIEVRIVTKYDWAYISNFIPGTLNNQITSERNALSEFKYNYDSWSGE